MKIYPILLVTLLLGAGIAQAYPNSELPAILYEKYPNASSEERKFSFRDDGNGVRIVYSAFSLPSEAEMEQLWLKVQEKRALEAQNQTEKLLSKQDLQMKYQNQINNLNTVVNNSNYIQAKTNWTNAEVIQQMKVFAWNDEVQAKGQIAILKIFRWMLW